MPDGQQAGHRKAPERATGSTLRALSKIVAVEPVARPLLESCLSQMYEVACTPPVWIEPLRGHIDDIAR